MNYIGTKVVNKAKYGKGEVISQDHNIITVQFDNNVVKRFDSEMCFKTFLDILEMKSENEVSKENKSLTLYEMALREIHKHEYVKVSYLETIKKYIEAVEQEIGFHRNHKPKTYTLIDGSRLSSADNKYVYVFETDSELNFPYGTNIKIYKGIGSISGKVISCEDFSIIIEAKEFLGKDLSTASFSPEPWFLLDALLNRTKELLNDPTQIAIDLVTKGENNAEHSNILKGQNNAVKMAINQPITFVWGAPGTGKTETLARIALKYINKGYKVLMLSYSNVAVDGAILRIKSKDKGKNRGKIIRYGYPKSAEILEDDYLSAYNLALQRNPELKQLRDLYVLLKKDSAKDTIHYIRANEELSKIRLKILDEQRAILREASFIATTVSQATIEENIFNQKFDVVMFDETSMAIIPLVFFAANLATKHFVCFGDFCQLPPIVLSRSSSALNTDIYEHCYITQAVKEGMGHKWLCMLYRQYRMHPEIADFVSKRMYKEMVVTVDSNIEERKLIPFFNPLAGHSIGLIDLDGMMTVCTKLPDKKSRVNPLSAFIDVGIVLDCSLNNSVAIISPYNAQARLLHAMIRDIQETADGKEANISAATVHQFQGSEKDIVVYDVTESFPRESVSRFLKNTDHDFSNRLFNVALTRARGKFLSVGNLRFIKNVDFPYDNIYSDLIKQYSNKPLCVMSRRDIIEAINVDWLKDIYEFSDDFQRYLFDIKEAKRSVRIDLPYNCQLSDDDMRDYILALEDVKNKSVKLNVRVFNKSVVNDILKRYVIESPKALNPITIIDDRIIWYGMPNYIGVFACDDKYISIEHNPTIRFCGKHTATNLRIFLDMNNVIDEYIPQEGEKADNLSTYITANYTCEKCRSPMRLKKKNKYYLACTAYPNCSNMVPLTVDIVDEYLFANDRNGKHCPKCGMSLEPVRGQYGIYIRCMGLKQHRFKINEV